MVDEIPPQALDNLLGVEAPPRKAGWAKPSPGAAAAQRRR